MAQVNKKDGKGTLLAAEIGAGVLAATAAAGAGYYFYASKKAPQHRRAAVKWARDMKAQVVREAKKELAVARKIDGKVMSAIVDRASKAYEGARSIRREDLMLAANELKQNWKDIEAELAAAAKKGVGAAKKAAKTATRHVRSSTKTASRRPAKKAAKKDVKKAAKKAAKKRR